MKLGLVSFKTHRFEEHYSVYSSLKEGFERRKHPFSFGFYRSFKKGEKIRRGDIIEADYSYYLFKGRCAAFAIGRKGYRFSEKDIALDGSKSQCCCGKTYPYKKCFYRSGSFKHDFLVFEDTVFNHLASLPLKDQNPAVNKFILKNVEEPYLLNLLINEYYNKGQNFEEYFSRLSSERKEELVKKLKSLEHNNATIDSIIRKQGFDIGSLDHVRLYKENSEDFIKYFTKKDYSEKRLILSDILDSDFINEKVIDWLNEHYFDLMREVCFS